MGIGREKGSLYSNPIIITYPEPGDPLPEERWMAGLFEVEIIGPVHHVDGLIEAYSAETRKSYFFSPSELTPIPPNKRLRVKLSKDQYIEVDADDVEEIVG